MTLGTGCRRLTHVQVTFDCRWWGDRHHGNADECHTVTAAALDGCVTAAAGTGALRCRLCAADRFPGNSPMDAAWLCRAVCAVGLKWLSVAA